MPSPERIRADRIASTVIVLLLVGIGATVRLIGHTGTSGGGTVVRGEMPLQVPDRMLGSFLIARTRAYDAQNLYEYIDGQAPLFIGYGFRNLLVAEYRSGGRSVVVDVYDMGTPRNAFGIFSAMRPPEGGTADIGSGGYQSENLAGFWKDRFYVRVQASSAPEAADAARAAAEWIPGASAPLPEVDAFPRDALVANSVRFIKSDAFGLSYMRDVFVAEYQRNGDSWKLFLVAADTPEDARRLFEEHAARLSETSMTQSGGLWGKMRYMGPTVMLIRGRLVAGCVGPAKKERAAALAGKLLERAEALLGGRDER